jgi:hypothetical protein
MLLQAAPVGQTTPSLPWPLDRRPKVYGRGKQREGSLGVSTDHQTRTQVILPWPSAVS